MTDTMNAVDIVAPGGPDVLQVITCDIPEPGDHDVLIKVKAAGINRPDVLQRQGLYPVPQDASPIPGLEVAGADSQQYSPGTLWRHLCCAGSILV